ncbi:MAG TPA: Error-prone repair protein ImuA [Cytophagales bacterium]|nr:Error-prone repair protein ImuA [Cytophagales bacterium]
MLLVEKAKLIGELQGSILRMQGLKSLGSPAAEVGLGAINNAFPNATFPVGCIHEFISASNEDTASTSGFVSGLLSLLMKDGGTGLWISASRTLFPPALKHFGLQPDHFIFIDLKKEKEVLEAMDEALKCAAINAVIGEVKDLSFTASRRLQLAVEQSQVTGFILRQNSRNLGTTACISRWKISHLSSESIDLPGVGFPAWRVELLKIRNGKPGSWDIQWKDGRFVPLQKFPLFIEQQKQKAG